MKKNHLYPHPPSRSYHINKPFNFFHLSSSRNEQEEDHHHDDHHQNLIIKKKNHDPPPPPSPSSSSINVVSTELSLSSSSFIKPNKNNNIINYKYNPSSSSSRKSKSQLLHSNNNNSIMQWGYSTALKLYDDPWKIKKVLTASDLGKLNRLLLSSNSIESLIGEALGHNNNHIDQEEEEEEMMNRVGKIVRVCDVDTMSMHELVLKRWASFKNYVMIGDWNQDFVKRRGLKKGDEIGLHWDSYNNCFNFSLLKPA